MIFILNLSRYKNNVLRDVSQIHIHCSDNKVNTGYKQGLASNALLCRFSKEHVTANRALTKLCVPKLQVHGSTKLKVFHMSWAAVWKMTGYTKHKKTA